jgi:pimeloyl-[acyl-carrier protein] synthase
MMTSAIEEFLRYDSPVQVMSRLVTADVSIAGTQIMRGQRVCLYYTAGNRDPMQFNAPHQLDITRQVNRHLTFGQGMHYCLGAALARLEGRIAINTVPRRLPNLRLETEALEWNPHVALRGLKSLPVTFDPSMAAKV